VLIVAVLAISAAAVLVRLAPEVPSVSASLWRTGLVGLLLAPSLLPRAARAPLDLRGWALGLGAGLLLALHFWAWIESLHRTTVLRSTLLVCLTPIWTGLFEWTLLRQPPQRATWVGLGVALPGVLLMNAGGGASGGVVTPLGDALALVGGALSAAYLFVGRVLRPRMELAPYGALVFLSCALWLLPIAALSGAPLVGFSPGAWAALLAMALGPQLLGHLGLNYAVRYLPAVIVSALILVEPVGAVALSAALLGEVPSLLEVIGGAVVLVGVAWAAWPRSAQRGGDSAAA
jgi:drug/metabolite transporter (DMT)-like permease